jgi:hypothetical protein
MNPIMIPQVNPRRNSLCASNISWLTTVSDIGGVFEREYRAGNTRDPAVMIVVSDGWLWQVVILFT